MPIVFEGVHSTHSLCASSCHMSDLQMFQICMERTKPGYQTWLKQQPLRPRGYNPWVLQISRSQSWLRRFFYMRISFLEPVQHVRWVSNTPVTATCPWKRASPSTMASGHRSWASVGASDHWPPIDPCPLGTWHATNQHLYFHRWTIHRWWFLNASRLVS